MADTGAISPGTMADDASIGTVAWSNPDNAKVSDAVYANASTLGCNGMLENSIKIVKGGSIGGTEKSTGANLPTTEAYVSYGGASDLWGLSWTANDINDSTFGVVFSAIGSGSFNNISHYLKATNFGFSIPAGSTINGILVEIQEHNLIHGSACPSLEKDTKILTVDGYKKISEFKVGDKLLSYNLNTDSIEEDDVVDVLVHPLRTDSEYYNISFGLCKKCPEHLERVVKATGGHLFYKDGKWIEAGQLKVGDILKDNDLENIVIEKITVVKNTTDDDWDLTTKRNHNFFANGILVHNASDGEVDHIRITVYYTVASTTTINMMMYT